MKDGYAVPWTVYKEMKELCLQYPNILSRQPRGKSEIEMIERSAREADPECYQHLLNALSKGTTYRPDFPRGRNQFYERRRVFFFLLARTRGMI